MLFLKPILHKFIILYNNAKVQTVFFDRVLRKIVFKGYFANNIERKGLATFYKTPPDALEKVVMPTCTLIKMLVHFCQQRIQIIFTYLHGSAKYEDYIRHIHKWINDSPIPTAVIGDMNWHYPEAHRMKKTFE